MGNCVSLSLPLDQSVNKVSQWIGDKGGYTCNLKKNLLALETTMEELKAKRDDLSRRVTREEDRGLQRLAELQVWFKRVETIEKEVTDILSARNVELQRLCVCGFCSKSFMSSYRYGKSVFLTLRKVEKLKCSGVFEVIAEKALTSEVEQRQLQPIIVGQETMLDKAWKHLLKDEVGIMGMYGMGGVGKTTLLTQLNNKFSKYRCGFDFVIWVVVSKELRLEKIQDEIAHKVQLSREEWTQKDKPEKGVHLYNFLRKKKFVLFLDDIWEKVDLAEIGIPFPTIQNRCKVAFTTRSQDVCAYMGAAEDSMEVQCLANDDAFDLFQKKVGKKTLGSDPELLDLAKIVAKKCCGLPLALNVIGETMSCKKTIQEWRHAIDILTSYAIEFSGMEDKILPLLKYSYDSLKGDQIRSCLLYCALFPEDSKIPKERLVEYWICEGIIDGSEDIEKAENKGYDIIGSLVGASLLMDGFDEKVKAFVSMHDVVREMALWIASDLGKQKEAFIVCAGVGLCELPKVKNWNIVRRMSLMDNNVALIVDSPECLELTTLLLQDMRLEMILSAFFKNMSKLAVLDLSGNLHLLGLPYGISNLVSLQYLNLSDTDIQELPKGLQELKKLIHLDLENTDHLENIAGISSLRNLKVLKLAGSGFLCDLNTVKELESLEHLEILTTTINHPSLPKQFLSSHRLISRTRSLGVKQSSEMSLPEHMDKLRDLTIRSCSIPEIKMGKKCSFLSLVKVSIEHCKCLRELTFLMFAPNLGTLHVLYAKELEDIINKEKACEVENSGIVPFQKLNDLYLANLPELKNIYWSPLPFPCLKKISVRACQNLKKLPLDSKCGTHGENGLVIRYVEKKWIKNVEWEDEATKNRFLSSCKQI